LPGETPAGAVPFQGGEVIPAGEAGHVADVANDRGGDHRADPEQLGQAGPGRGDGNRELLSGVAHLCAGAAQVGGELGGELPAAAATAPEVVTGPSSCAAWPAVICVATPPGSSPQHRVQPAHQLGPQAAQVPVPLGADPQHRRVVISCHRTGRRRAQRRDGHRPGVIRVVLARRASRQQPHPGTELGLHIQHRRPR
jgi:hypothetical protein